MNKIIAVFSFCPVLNVFAQNTPYISDTVIDLNGDHISEKIHVEINHTTDGDFILTVGGHTIKGILSDRDIDIDGFRIIDINQYDSQKEIAIRSSGASDDYEFLIYRYDGHQIILMNHIDGYLTFKGNGIVYADGWMGFWSIRDKYMLDNHSGKLVRVPQFAYYVGVDLKVKNNFTIYRERDLKTLWP